MLITHAAFISVFSTTTLRVILIFVVSQKIVPGRLDPGKTKEEPFMLLHICS